MDNPSSLCCGRQVRILVVDDDEDNLWLVREQLRQLLDCFVVSADNGHDALLLAKTSQPDLILLDIMLPGLDGYEVVRRIRQDPQIQAIPVIGLSAMARIQDEELAMQAGCNDYIRKPYELESLATVLERFLKIPCSSYSI